MTHTLNCEVVVNDLESACTLTRFFLSDHPGWGRTVTLRGVEEYVRSHFTDPRGYRFSCDHDVLLLRRRWVGNRVHRIFIWRMGPWQVRRSFTCTSTPIRGLIRQTKTKRARLPTQRRRSKRTSWSQDKR